MPRAPDFWAAGSQSALPALLAPLAWLYGAAQSHRRRNARPVDIGIPVISVGNLVAGGAGKTPTALALALLLRKLGRNPAFVSRGYGGSQTGPLQVDASKHTASDVGDEPLLLAATAPTWIGRDRPAAALLAKQAGHDLIIADDAHQTHALARRLNLLVVDAGYGFGNGRLLPAGPLRESIEDGLARSHAVIRIGQDTVAPKRFGTLPVFQARLRPDPEDVAAFKGQRMLAFAGIGRPEKFFQSVIDTGADVVEMQAFADHAAYTPDRIMRLVEEAHRLNAMPVTTAKDLMRFPLEARAMVRCLRVDLDFDDEAGLLAFLRERLQHV
ncbi:tetraacyldisaccharide 4'-kinase [Ferrovibrio sp.]|uniref:tetraacyldisaccharide 4'-kinase n=1 Tax=Ferrovibrio sp. TaxID=1917215 RepID=UPI0025BE43A0|nr:tetraacyldisaccharide 4'-kinase [Ferrovibrio sp.]MBX3455041.1 tetraacyldisaccharide 4'-kinase [Ferrovibrio sp.]